MSHFRFRSRGSRDKTPPIDLGVGQNLQFPYCNYYSPVTYRSSTRYPPIMEECWDWVNPGPPYRVGYSFFLKRMTAKYIDSDSVSVAAYMYKYDGKVGMGAVSIPEIVDAYDGYTETAGSWGATAWNKFKPVQPMVDLGQALVELRDFPSLFKLALKKFKDLGSLYLNYQFGWRPFLKDLFDFIQTQKRIERGIRFVRNANGKWLKRAGTVKDETTTTTNAVSAVLTPPLNSYLSWPIGSNDSGTRILTIKDRIWFEAMFKFYIPDLSSDSCEDIWTSPLLRRLYGLELTPALLWEIMPWSWLQDWCLDVGSIISNFSTSAYDNLVAKYAYVMRHRSVEVTYHSTKRTRSQIPICANGRVTGYQTAVQGPQLTAKAVFTAECKERAKASKWGFGNEGDALTDRQLAILIALGLSRS